MVQQVRKSITALVLFVVSGALFAQSATAPLTLKAEAPERYTVVPGDTLWGIAQRYTESPWRWPELWNLNRDDIRNPHLIYPGNVIVLDRARGQLSLSADAAPTLKLSPRSRAEKLPGQEIPSIPGSLIEPFLSRPLVVEPDGLDNAPTIVATQSDRVMLAAGNNAYVRGIGNSQEENWYVYRRGGPLVDPETNRTLAYEAIYLATAQVTRSGDPATITLTNAVREVGAGDKLVAAGRPEIVSYVPRAPGKSINGRIMSIYGGLGRVGEAGPQSVISINRGKADGVEIGHVLALYALGGSVRDTTKSARDRDARISLPNERAGLAFVFRVFDRVSYALVMEVTRPVGSQDAVQTP